MISSVVMPYSDTPQISDFRFVDDELVCVPPLKIISRKMITRVFRELNRALGRRNLGVEVLGGWGVRLNVAKS